MKLFFSMLFLSSTCFAVKSQVVSTTLYTGRGGDINSCVSVFQAANTNTIATYVSGTFTNTTGTSEIVVSPLTNSKLGDKSITWTASAADVITKSIYETTSAVRTSIQVGAVKQAIDGVMASTADTGGISVSGGGNSQWGIYVPAGWFFIHCGTAAGTNLSYYHWIKTEVSQQ